MSPACSAPPSTVMPRQRRSCSRWSMRSCADSPRISPPTTPSSPPHSSTSAWLRLVGDDGQKAFANRAHFFAAAAEAMRRILMDRARRRLAAKRGGGERSVPLEEVEIPMPAADDEQLLAVNEAQNKFAALDISEPTAKRWWAYARA